MIPSMMVIPQHSLLYIDDYNNATAGAAALLLLLLLHCLSSYTYVYYQ
jgi:hypothetical protein